MSTQNVNLDDFDMTMDEAIDSGDPELMEKALAKYGDEQDVDSEVDDVEEDDDLGNTDESKSDAEVTEDDGESSDQELEKVIKSKNGKHEIPYSVLESERKRREEVEALLAQERQEREQLQAKASENASALENVKARLEIEGMDVDSMLKNPDEISEGTWKELEDDYGTLGKMFRKLYENQQVIKQPDTQNQNNQKQEHAQVDVNTQVSQAIQQNSDLSNWQKSDPDRWSEAIRIDNELRNDPDWVDKSFAERFAEVAARTKKNFGDEVESRISAKEKANQIIDKSKQPVPDSLSDIGQSPTKNKSTLETLDGLNADQIAERMESMSASEIEAVLSAGF